MTSTIARELRELVDLHPHAVDVVNRAADTLDYLLKAQPVQPAPLQEVWYVGSKTFSTLFATKEAADKFCSQFPVSVGIWPERMAVIGGAG